MSIVALWLGLGMIGTAMIRDTRFPAWLAAPIALIGFANAGLAGVPVAYAGASLITVMIFGALALLTSVWALVTGTWLLRMRP